MAYDTNNIFAQILRNELPCKKVYEDEFALAFHDIAPHAAVHVLVIPKGEYVSFVDFSANASPELAAGFMRAIGTVARQLELDQPGYRLVVNVGENGRQHVPHLHFHILGGERLGIKLAG